MTAMNYRNHYLQISKTYPSAFALKCFLGKNPHFSLRGENIAGKKICEIGFGDGRDLNLFIDLGMNVYGVEPDEQVVNHTTKKFGDKIPDGQLCVGSNVNIPFGNKSFDYVYASAAIYYLPSSGTTILNALTEANRVLVPKGLLFVSFSCSDNHTLDQAEWVDQNTAILEDPFYKLRKGQRYHVYNNKQEIKEDFAKTGFQACYIGDYDIDWFGTRERWYLAIAKKI